MPVLPPVLRCLTSFKSTTHRRHSMFKKWLSKLLITKILVTLGVIALVAVSAFIFSKKYPEKAKEIWKFLKKDEFENLYTIYDYIAMAMPSKDEFILTNVLRFMENAQKLYLLFGEPDIDKYKKYLDAEGYQIMDNPYVITFVMHTGMNKFIKVEKKFQTFGAHLAVNKINFPDGDSILESYFKDKEHDGDDDEDVAPAGSGGGGKKARRQHKRRDDAEHREYYTFATKKDFNLQSKIDMFWELHPSGVYIHNHREDDDAQNKKDSQAFVIEDFQVPDYTIFGKGLKLVETFSRRLTVFRENKIQRSYLLIGRAGTGKSTFCLEVAKHLQGKKVMKISAELFASFNKKDLDFIFQYLRPEFVVIDDFDRVYSDYSPKSQDILYFFESLKNPENKHITLFCTVNSMVKMGEAIIRPGRFDEIMVFNLPDAKEREILIREFAKVMGFEPSEIQIERLVKVTQGFSHAYLKEYCLELKFDPDFESLIRRIAVTRQFVDDFDFDDTADLDIDKLLKNIQKGINRRKKAKEALLALTPTPEPSPAKIR